jgi:hypothetical protein
VGLSPEVLNTFLQRKAFMRIATTHSYSTTAVSTSPSLANGSGPSLSNTRPDRHLHPIPKAAGSCIVYSLTIFT